MNQGLTSPTANVIIRLFVGHKFGRIEGRGRAEAKTEIRYQTRFFQLNSLDCYLEVGRENIWQKFYYGIKGTRKLMAICDESLSHKTCTMTNGTIILLLTNARPSDKDHDRHEVRKQNKNVEDFKLLRQSQSSNDYSSLMSR